MRPLFFLTYGVDVIPIEIRTRSLCIQQLKEEKNEELMRIELELLEEIRKDSKVRSEEYKRSAVQYHNAKVKL